MGNICSCNFLTGEDKKEFKGFSGNSKDGDKFIYILKKQNNNYNEKDKKYYKKSSDYENMIENTSIQDIEITEEPVENYNGTVQVIQWKNET